MRPLAAAPLFAAAPPVCCETIPRGVTGPDESRFCAGDESRSFETSLEIVSAYILGQQKSQTHTDVIVQLDSPGGIELHLFQSLAYNVVRLSLTCLSRLDRSGLVDVAFVVDVELAKSILQAEYLVLLKLRILPAQIAGSA